MSHHIVEAKDLEYSYPDGTAALRGVSFRIEHGESVGIVGANGAGKSTLLLHLNGYLIALLKGFKHTKIIAAHDLDMIRDLCARTILLHEGRIAADGRTEKVLGDQGVLEQCGL